MKFIYLSKAFYQKYSNCTEILIKENRPYACLRVNVQGKDFAIPFRHNIQHKYAFHTVGNCGLDYTKAVPITDDAHIDDATPRIDSAEYQAVKGKEHIIEKEMARYIELYKKAKLQANTPFYQNIIKYSALQYFESDLITHNK